MRRQAKRVVVGSLALLTFSAPFSGLAQSPGNSSGVKTTRKTTKTARHVTAAKSGSKIKPPIAKNPVVSSAQSSGFTRPASMPRIAPPTTSPAPLITYFTQDTKDWLRAGDVMHVTLQGTPGGQAAFHIGGLADSIAMQETTPGLYIGSWPVPTDKPLIMMTAPVMGDISVGGKNAVGMQSSRPVSIDTIPPRAENITPAAQSVVSTLTPVISADLTDQGSGINASSVRLIVNDRDLTGEANVTTERIIYKPIVPLLEGDQTVQLQVSDRAGGK